MAADTRTGTGPRDRFRAQVQQEVKTAALRQLAEGGPEALSLNAIAKQLGMTGPALYRYFANRDSLLTELVVDAYGDLASTLRRTAEACTADAVTRLTELVRAYRRWALAEPHRYRLLFRAPLQGYDAQSTSLVEASQPAMTVLLDAVEGCRPPAELWRAASGVLEVTARTGGAHPNIDFALGVLAESMRMVDGAGEAVFAVARSAGWIAHGLEEYQHRLRYRIRATYTGPEEAP